MSRKRGPLTLYIVAWEDGTVKVGVSERRRWLSFRGEWSVWDLIESPCAYDIETEIHRMLGRAAPRRFSSRFEAVEYLGNRGGGWMECYQLSDITLRAGLLDSCAEHARRIARGNAEENRREQNTENRRQLPLDEASPKSTRATSEAK